MALKRGVELIWGYWHESSDFNHFGSLKNSCDPILLFTSTLNFMRFEYTLEIRASFGRWGPFSDQG